MALLWQIKAVSETEKEARRYALDFFGTLALASTVGIGLIICYFGHLYRLKFGTVNTESPRHSHGSKSAKRRPGVINGFKAQLAAWIYLWEWFLNQKIQCCASVSVTRKWALFISSWSLWLLILSTAWTGDDYFHLTKRLAQIAAAFFPAQYLLSSRWTLQFIAPLTLQTHETVNVIHRWLGRSMYVLLMAHGALYINYFLRSGRLDRFGYRDVILGLCGLLIMNGIFMTSLPRFRSRAYGTFQVLHQVLSWLILPVAWFHIRYIRWYIALATLIFLIDRVGRLLWQKQLPLQINRVSESAIGISSPIATWKGTGKSIPAGSHFYIGDRTYSWLRQNPLSSILFSGNEECRLWFIARTQNGFTQRLKSATGKTLLLTTEGPYGLSAVAPDVSVFDAFLFVAGGIGLTAVLPVWLETRMKIRRMREDVYMGDIRLVWVVRDEEEARAILENVSLNDFIGIEIFISRMATSLVPDNAGESNTAGAIDILMRNAKPGRPDILTITNDFCRDHRRANAFVMVCGPKALSSSVQKALYEHSGVTTVWFWDEKFDW